MIAERTASRSDGKSREQRRLWLLRNWHLWLFLLLAVADWMLIRARVLEHPMGIVTGLAGLAVLAWSWECARSVYLAVHKRVSLPTAVSRILILGGLVILFGSGVVNWLWSLQGYVVLNELDALPLQGGAHLRAFERGPLAGLEELDLVLQLEELELLPDAEGRPFPTSHLRVQRADGRVEVLRIDPWSPADLGTLRFYQGAFGFAPKVVLQKNDVTLFEEIVAFTTERREDSGEVSFEGEVPLGVDDIIVRGSVDLTSLDEGLRGHARLAVSIWKGEELLGRGLLNPGFFAEINQGYRVGFAGLEKWSEIDFSRRNYRDAARWGLVLCLIGIGLSVAVRWMSR